MTVASRALVAAILAASTQLSACARVDEQKPSVRYEANTGIAAIVFEHGSGHEMVSVSESESPNDGTSESLASPIWNCGNDDFLCLSTAHSVFAVPIGKQLHEGLRYEVGGAVLKVLKCYESSAKQPCPAALVESECRKFAQVDGCESDSDTTENPFSQATYFIYNAGRGVMSYGVSPIAHDQNLRDEDSYLGVATQLVLRDQFGLLKANIELSGLPPAGYDEPKAGGE